MRSVIIRYRAAAFLFLCLMPGGIGIAQTKSQKIDQLLKSNEGYGILNGTVLVADHGDVIYKKAFGLADAEWNVPNQIDSKYNIASVTKQFVAMLVLQQVEEGRLKLEGKITDYLPNYPRAAGDEVTIRHLLSHTSGIPNYTDFTWFGDSLSRYTYPTPDSFVNVFADSALAFPPGSKYMYDNSGYFLLGVILEKMTGKPLEKLLHEKILDPLRMTNTGLDDQLSILPKRSAGYNRGMLENMHAGYWDRSSLYAAGGMYSTVEDLYTWDQALYTDKLLPGKYRDMLFSPAIAIDSSASYGFGWFLKKFPLSNMSDSISVVYHTGTITGFNALIFRVPGERRTFICLNNLLVGREKLIAMAVDCMDILHDLPYEEPKQSLAEIIGKTMAKSGISSALKRYEELKSGPGGYRLIEEEMNTLGYEFKRMKKYNEAIEVFKINAAEFPKSANAYDSLGEAYMDSGDTGPAIINYKKSIELDPKNAGAIGKLKKLQSKP